MIAPGEILAANILIVDDKDANVSLLSGMLRVAGYTSVHSTTNPASVASLHQANNYSLILLDLQMPIMDGFAVMEALGQIEAEGYLPVLVITAQPDHKLRSLEAGARDFVSKPFDFAELRARVRNVLEVRLLHIKLKQTILELEASREVIRLQTLAEQKRSERELTLAQQTQESLLPRFVPQFENFHITAFNRPTRYVGGDFYDFLQLDSREWMGVLADVCGKGLPAALLSSMVLGALSTQFRSGMRPAEVLNQLNRLLCEKSLRQQFVTMFLFLLNPDGAGQFISAGHNPAYLYCAATGEIEKLSSGLCVLGIMETSTWHTTPFQLATGDLLVVYSDGLTDAENAREEMFGEDKLREIICRKPQVGSLALEQTFLTAIEEFTGGMPQTDDITFLIVEKYQ